MLQFMDCLLLRLALGHGTGTSEKGMLPCMAGAGLIAFCLPAIIELSRETRKGEIPPLLVRGRVLEISSSASQKSCACYKD